MPTLIIGVTGTVATVFFARAGRRFRLVDRLRAERPGRPLPRWLQRPVARALDDAALDLSPEQALHVWGLATLVAGLFGMAAAGRVGAGLALAVLVGGPIGLRLSRHRRSRLVAAAVPATLEEIASELRAGGTLATAVHRIAAGDGHLAHDFARVEARAHLGASFGDAMRSWGAERRAYGVDAAAGALALCSGLGGRSADALDALASSLRARLSVLVEARAQSSQARMSAVVIGSAPLAYVAFSAAFDPRSVDALVATAGGRLCAAVGLGLEVVGVWWMRRIIVHGNSGELA
jgi:tight adherence protein B